MIKQRSVVVLSHSFRTNSRIISKAVSESDSISFVYPSPWYWNPNEKALYEKCGYDMHPKVLSYFASELKKNLGSDLFILKCSKPTDSIELYCHDNDIDKIYYDMPLFGKDALRFSENVNVEIVDSDSYDPDCERMTAKSRWTYWAANRKNIKHDIYGKPVKPIEGIGVKFVPKQEYVEEIDSMIQNAYKRVTQKLSTYNLTRNERDGSLQLSKLLHWGLIDGPEITSNVLDLARGFIQKDHPVVPLLRQLAFREMSIRKSRIKMLSLTDNADTWARSLLDIKSYNNLIDSEHEPSFTISELFEGKTKNLRLNEEVLKCSQHRWMPNRARMWFAGEVYWGLGGGMKSLEAIVHFFNTFCDDAQSPNNWVSCVESMRMQYGKVMRFNEKRTFRLLSGQERI